MHNTDQTTLTSNGKKYCRSLRIPDPLSPPLTSATSRTGI